MSVFPASCRTPNSGRSCTLPVLALVSGPAPDSFSYIGENGAPTKDREHFSR